MSWNGKSQLTFGLNIGVQKCRDAQNPVAKTKKRSLKQGTIRIVWSTVDPSDTTRIGLPIPCRYRDHGVPTCWATPASPEELAAQPSLPEVLRGLLLLDIER